MRDLTITTGVAAALLVAGCSRPQEQDNGWTASQDTAVCVDKQGQRVRDAQCPQQRVAHSGGGGMASGMGSAFLWYYLARNAVLPPYGGRVAGGSFTPMAGRSYARAPAYSRAAARGGSIARGGFGASARGFGGAGA